MTSTRPHDALPTTHEPSGYCPNPECGKYVEFMHPAAWGTQDDMIWPRYQAATSTPPPSRMPEMAIRLAVWVCPACRETCVIFTRQVMKRTVKEDGTPHRAYDDTPMLIWPARRPRELETVVPEKIRDLFAEGSVAENAGALRAAAALYRATVEEICADRGAQGNNLNQKINDLKNRGVEAGIVDDLHEARLTGNWSLHQGEPFAADEVADVADLIVEATVVLYVQPEERRRMREARRARRSGSGAGA
ncbi:DUF4145 domain-containing protein [Nocardiopsis dassonvillei]|uniref:DUF4145 domain-containing protein n=1 Tax=Nocardiopsis dassonvillei TaxID=2014 RepID=UPI00367015E8